MVAFSTREAAESFVADGGRSLEVLEGSAGLTNTEELVEGISMVVLRGLTGELRITRDWSLKGEETVVTVLLRVAGMVRVESRDAEGVLL